MSTIEATNSRVELGQKILNEHASKDLLRLLTCGSVDDGKSTLLGRLLLEAGAVYEDQLDALRRDSDKHGTTGQEIDAALLLDGLEDEQQQGITIDVAYRYFATPRRKFIIADTPGHEQFTRNMATGASTADLAMILVDASQGILTQTRRHAYIVSMLGINQVVLAVNKMDRVDYQQDVFKSICEEFQRCNDELGIPKVNCVPLSALKGDNVARPSNHTPWYDAPPLLGLLETIKIHRTESEQALRFPVQWVNRPNSDFRGFSGQAVAGNVKVGDGVMVLPSRKSSTVDRLVTYDGDVQEAGPNSPVTITLADEIDISRGDMIVHTNEAPHVSQVVHANLIWMSETPLVPGKQYWIKNTTRKTSGEIEQVDHSIDFTSLRPTPTTTLNLNQIGRCRLRLASPLFYDDYQQNRRTGSLILVDRITNETVAAGMLISPNQDKVEGHWDDVPKGMNLERVANLVDLTARERRYVQKAFTILITGLSGSGKTTLATTLDKYLFDSGKKSVLLDGQSLRFGISRDLGFTAEERSENLRRAAEIAKMLNDAGLICIAAFVAPHDDVRSRAIDLIGQDRCVHVHLNAPVETCRSRDRFGRYDAADKGEITSFPGVTFDYHEPTTADLVLSSDELDPSQCLAKVIRLLAEHDPSLSQIEAR